MPSNHLISAVPFSCLQSFPASWSFPMSPLFATSSQSIGASASTSALPMDIQGWFSLGLTDLILLQSKGLSKVLSNTIAQKHQFISAFFMVKHSHLSMTKGKIIVFTIQTFTGKVMSLLFNMLFMFVIAFLPRSTCLLFHGCSHHPQ